MNGSKTRAQADAETASVQSTDPDGVIVTLENVQRFAAEQRVIAEEVLAKARDFEEQIANERRAIDELVAQGEGALIAEHEAESALAGSLEELAAVVAAEKQARGEVANRQRVVDERRDARLRVESELARIRIGFQQLSGRDGLNPDAVQRMLERRIADRLRENAKRGGT
jgi:hypothetical protein